MKKIVSLLVASLMTSVASAYMVQNPEFNSGSAFWSDAGTDGNAPWGGPYYYADGPDTIVSMGGWGNNVDWSNAYIYQNTGFSFLANTVYQLTAVWRNSPNLSESLADNIKLSLFETVTWSSVASTLASSSDRNWTTTMLTFDTTTAPGIVGQGIGVGFNLTSGTGTWVHVNSIMLVPEPSSVALLGLGAMMLLKTGRRGRA